MGLARATVNLLLAEASRSSFRGSIVTLGRQHVYVTAEEVEAMAQAHGVSLRPFPVELHREQMLSEKGYVSDDWLLKSLGFDTIVRVDYSDYEAPDWILDLNAPDTPDPLNARFDVVLDSGTLEHVFDIAAGLRHCVRMVRPGGRVIHLTPSSNCVEHGFYSVSPTLFADFYAASNFTVNRVWLCEIPVDLPRGVWNVYDYLGSSERFISLGQLSDQIWFSFSVATADKEVAPRTPQQSFYTNTWEKAQTEREAHEPAPSPTDFEEGSRSQRLMSKLDKLPWLRDYAAKGIVQWRRWRHERSIKQHRLPYPFLGKF